jgi:Skp family chaperone for outer membrane proteins
LFEIAQINKEGITATRKEMVGYSNDYGNRREVRSSVLEVSIPFVGSAQSFMIQPSSAVIPSNTLEIRGQSLVLTIPDDTNAEAAVQRLVAQLNQNLASLRKDYDQVKPQLEQEISAAAERRKQQVQAEQERDKKLSFPVCNG